jgi:CHASE1-domain containing sensor protein
MAAIVRRTWVLWLAGLAALAGLGFSAAGWAMASSFAAAAPERRDHRQAAVAYLALGGVSAATLVAVGIALARRARRRSDLGSPAV